MSKRAEDFRVDLAFMRVAIGAARSAKDPQREAHCWALAVTHLFDALQKVAS